MCILSIDQQIKNEMGVTWIEFAVYGQMFVVCVKPLRWETIINSFIRL